MAFCIIYSCFFKQLYVIVIVICIFVIYIFLFFNFIDRTYYNINTF
uniref:Uncharacterized protein n=1 Tax=viral metagenome TaxID=1070528 RepID=A0A6C0EVD0_9ZZZZ